MMTHLIFWADNDGFIVVHNKALNGGMPTRYAALPRQTTGVPRRTTGEPLRVWVVSWWWRKKYKNDAV